MTCERLTGADLTEEEWRNYRGGDLAKYLLAKPRDQCPGPR
jgi:hypothetical protein